MGVVRTYAGSWGVDATRCGGLEALGLSSSGGATVWARCRMGSEPSGGFSSGQRKSEVGGGHGFLSETPVLLLALVPSREPPRGPVRCDRESQ